MWLKYIWPAERKVTFGFVFRENSVAARVGCGKSDIVVCYHRVVGCHYKECQCADWDVGIVTV